jgi:hypothetical protein
MQKITADQVGTSQSQSKTTSSVFVLEGGTSQSDVPSSCGRGLNLVDPVPSCGRAGLEPVNHARAVNPEREVAVSSSGSPLGAGARAARGPAPDSGTTRRVKGEARRGLATARTDGDRGTKNCSASFLPPRCTCYCTRQSPRLARRYMDPVRAGASFSGEQLEPRSTFFGRQQTYGEPSCLLGGPLALL